MTKDFANPLTGRLVSQAYYNRVMRKIAREKAIEDEKLEMTRIRLERQLNNRPKHLPPPVQQFVVNNDRNVKGNKNAKRSGLKRKVIYRPKISKVKNIAPRTGLKRKVIRGHKIYINPLTANKVKKSTYLKAVKELQRKQQELEETIKRVNHIFSFMADNQKNSIKLPMIDLSLNDARHYEFGFVNKRSVMFERNSSFVNLFRRRMRRNGNGWKTVSVTIDAVITDDRAPLGKQDKTKTFGPFEESQPRGLSTRDIYQFLMFSLLNDNCFEQQSGEHIISIGGTITKLKKLTMVDVRMGDTRLMSALVDKCNNYKRITQNKGICVQDYIYEVCRGVIGFKRYTKQTLTEEINKYVFDKEEKKPSTRELLDWRDNCYTNVSIYALDPFYNKFVSSPVPRNNGLTVRLCFICKDGHCSPILNEHLITKTTKGSPLLNHLDLIQMNSKQSKDKIEICKTVEDYYKVINNNNYSKVFTNKASDRDKNYENYLIVLPDGHKGKDMMIETMQRTQTYIEYFHYDGTNQIDGFITPDLKNMVAVNNDYELRENICYQLFEKYPVDAFHFNNQGLTSIAVNLFKQLYGHIPMSSFIIDISRQ